MSYCDSKNIFFYLVRIFWGKKIDLGMGFVEELVVLVVSWLLEILEIELDNIRIWLYLIGGKIYLLLGVKLIVMDESGEELMDVEFCDGDNFI